MAKVGTHGVFRASPIPIVTCSAGHAHSQGSGPDEHGDRHDGRYGGYRSHSGDASSTLKTTFQRDFAPVNYAHIGRRLR